MHPSKVLYAIIFFGSVAYFFLYGIIMKKLPNITITYRKDSLEISQDEPQKEETNTKFSNDNKFSADTKTVIHRTKRPPNIIFTSSKPRTTLRTEELQDSRKMEDFLFNFGRNNENVANNITTAKTEHKEKANVTPRKNGLEKLMVVMDGLEKTGSHGKKMNCVTPKRVGPLKFETKGLSLSTSGVERELSFVKLGGKWKPTFCRAKKVAIVIPFRDRQQHLIMFLLHMHRFLRWQLLDYQIYVVEQSAFNRGMLMNIGFKEALKRTKYDCVIFHDVDLLPEDDRNDYSCPSSPRHMSTAVDTMDYKLAYKKIFGGVEAFWPDHFRLTNGFPNRYWGWGGEDDDLYIRVMEKKSLGLTRPAYQIGRYTMQKHQTSTNKNPKRHILLRDSKVNMEQDGLNSLKYKIVKQKDFPLYTFISVDIKP